MNVIKTGLSGVVLIEPSVFADTRGAFAETWHSDRYADAGISAAFVQDNVSVSKAGVLRGLHLQYPRTQAKLVSVLEGEIYDVAVDVRIGSPTFGRWVGHILSAENHRQLFVPAGFAHGFAVTGQSATVLYKCDDYYAPQDALSLLWNDPDLGIDWPLQDPLLSSNDSRALRLCELAPDRLPRYHSDHRHRPTARFARSFERKVSQSLDRFKGSGTNRPSLRITAAPRRP